MESARLAKSGETQVLKPRPGALKLGVPRATIKVRLASYLGIRPLSLTTAVRPHPDVGKLKYGITQLY